MSATDSGYNVAHTVDDQSLKPLRAALAAARSPFHTFGDIPVTEPFKIVLSGNAPDVSFPLALPVDSALAPLLEACQQASFGRGNQDVLDPTYRRALVLHAKDFGLAPGSAVDPLVLGVIPAIEAALFGDDFDLGVSSSVLGVTRRRVVPKIDKLNVYSEGDFFKSHVDTPRAPNMFGTLLINFPVEHVGGQLVIHAPKGGERALSGDRPRELEKYETHWGTADTLGWVAFFSDCEHEVLPVLSGHRVTLTYNLFMEGVPSIPRSVSGVSKLAVEAIVAALTTPGLLGDTRARLCFHLKHNYPIDIRETKANAAMSMLKGRDALVYSALVAAGLVSSFHYAVDEGDDEENKPDWYDWEPYAGPLRIFPSEANDFGRLSHSRVTWINQYNNAQSLESLGVVAVNDDEAFWSEDEEEDLGEEASSYDQAEDRIPKFREHMVAYRAKKAWNKSKKSNKVPFGYIAYGNDSTLATCYASICIIACLPGHEIVWPKRDTSNW